MRTRHHSISTEQIQSPAGQNGIQNLRPRCSQLASVALAAAALLTAATSPAAQLTWDAGNTNNGASIDAASGSWNTDTTTNFVWNIGGLNTNWTQASTTSPLNAARFNGPDAADGTYQVVVDAGQVSASNLTINASGYVFSGSPIDLRNATAALSATNLFFIADSKSVIFSNTISGANTGSEFHLGNNGAPATAVFYGLIQGMQTGWESTNGSVAYLAGGSGSTLWTIDADVRMTNGTFASGGGLGVGNTRNGSMPNNATRHAYSWRHGDVKSY